MQFAMPCRLPAAARSVLLPLLLATPVLAQVQPGIYGYLVSGRLGTGGEFCRTFDCTPRPMTVMAGDLLTFTVNAPFQTLYVLGLSASASSCVPLPGFANALVLDAPIDLLTAGFVDQQSPILSCWDGTTHRQFALPPGLPAGLQFSTQAVALVTTLSGEQLAFSVAVTATVL